jgi:hypothetical protein
MDRLFIHSPILLMIAGCAQTPPARIPAQGGGPAGPTESCLAAAQGRLGGIPTLQIQGPLFDAKALRWERQGFTGGFQEPSPAPEARQAFSRIAPPPVVHRIIGHGEARGANPSTRIWLGRAQRRLEMETAPWTFAADGRGRTPPFAAIIEIPRNDGFSWKVQPLSRDASPRLPPTVEQLATTALTVPIPTAPIRWLLERDPPLGVVWFEVDAVEFETADGRFCLPCVDHSRNAKTPSEDIPGLLF